MKLLTLLILLTTFTLGAESKWPVKFDEKYNINLNYVMYITEEKIEFLKIKLKAKKTQGKIFYSVETEIKAKDKPVFMKEEVYCKDEQFLPLEKYKVSIRRFKNGKYSTEFKNGSMDKGVVKSSNQQKGINWPKKGLEFNQLFFIIPLLKKKDIEYTKVLIEKTKVLDKEKVKYIKDETITVEKKKFNCELYHITDDSDQPLRCWVSQGKVIKFQDENMSIILKEKL